jgi:hypothetical protein
MFQALHFENLIHLNLCARKIDKHERGGVIYIYIISLYMQKGIDRGRGMGSQERDGFERRTK